MTDESIFFRNLALQPECIASVLNAPAAAFPRPGRGGRIMLVGTGSNHHVAQIARWLWMRHARVCVQAWTSLDFIRFPARPGPADVVAILSHRGTKTFSLQTLRVSRRSGAKTVLLTGRGSPIPRGVQFIETCEAEETGAYTKSVTTTLAWLVRWIGSAPLTQAVRVAARKLDDGPRLPRLHPNSDLVLLGDCLRNWVAREASLKIFETAHLPARAFGLEEFLHGPRLSLSPRSVVVGFCSDEEPRWEAVRQYLRTVGISFLPVPGPGGSAKSAAWLGQLYWGQRLALAAALAAGRDPDRLRTDEPKWRRARKALVL